MGSPYHRSTWAEIAAGAGLGVLVGALVGLSATGVVGGVITTLTAMLATFLGLARSGTILESSALPRARIASFGLAGALALALGVASRAHDWLGNTVEHDVRQWTSVGASSADAVDLVAWQRLGVMPRGRQVSESPPKSSAASSVLFSAAAGKCSLLLGDRFSGTAQWLDAMSHAGPEWGQVAQSIAAVPEKNQRALLNATYKLACGG